MKIFLAIMLAGFGGWMPLAFGQGTVTYSTLSASQFADYQNSAVWTLFLDYRGSGWLSDSTQTNAYTTSLGGAYTASILVASADGLLSATNRITNGRFNTTGATAGTSLNTADILSGIVIAMSDAFTPNDGTVTLTDLYLGNNYQPNVADVSSASFSGILCTFSDPTSVFNALVTLNQSNGGAEERSYVLGIAADPTPEPSSLALIGMGGVAIYLTARHKK